MQPVTQQIEPKTILSFWIQEARDMGYTNVHLAHFGPIDQDLINSFTLNMEDFMVSGGDKKQLIKRVFSILIEGLQNILIHGNKVDGEQQALVMIAYNERGYYLTLGNLAQKADNNRLTGYLDKLNGMTEEEVKAFYLQTLNNGLISDKGGAGLGFITIRMKSRSMLDYRFKDVNEELMLFTITSVISRIVD